MAVAYQIDIDTAAATAMLNRFGRLGFGSLMETLGTLVENQTKHRIVAEKTDPSGRAWPPLAASTIAAKGNGNILVDSGRLLGSIFHASGSHEAVVGTNVEYAGYLQGGTRKMPARAFIGISDENWQQIDRAVSAWIARNL